MSLLTSYVIMASSLKQRMSVSTAPTFPTKATPRLGEQLSLLSSSADATTDNQQQRRDVDPPQGIASGGGGGGITTSSSSPPEQRQNRLTVKKKKKKKKKKTKNKWFAARFLWICMILLILVAVVVMGWSISVLHLTDDSSLVYGKNDATSSSSQLLSPFLATKVDNNNKKTFTSQLVGDHLPPKRRPTHKACQGYDGIYHIAMSDVLGGVGTAFFQLVISQLLYARQYNLLPWVHFNNISQVFYDPQIHGGGPGVHVRALGGGNVTYVHRYPNHPFTAWRRDQTPGPPAHLLQKQSLQLQDYYFPGTGVWEHYFEAVSDFVPGDASCESKPFVTMDLYLITPGMHGYSNDFATRCWRYDYLPAYITQPHRPLTVEWLASQRQRAHDVIHNARHGIRLLPYLRQWAQRANPQCNDQDNIVVCLGLHIRHSDKAAGRRHILVSEFWPYVRAFFHEITTNNQQQEPYIYLATDSSHVLTEIQTSWPAYIHKRVRMLDQVDPPSESRGGGASQKQLSNGAKDSSKSILRSANATAPFDLASATEQRHRSNQEALAEIWALSQCQYLIHSLSALSEASIWINLDLHNHSVNLEDEDHMTVAEFATLLGTQQSKASFSTISSTRHGDNGYDFPFPLRTFAWWDTLRNMTPTFYNFCDTTRKRADDAPFQGILHIAAVAEEAGAGHAFFTSILHQLMYADMHRLQPWIHLQPLGSVCALQPGGGGGIANLYDATAHGVNETMNTGTLLQVVCGQISNQEVAGGPGPPQKGLSLEKSFHVEGNGIWQSYFEPVSDFDPNSALNCPEEMKRLPIYSLSPSQVAPDIESLAPWAPRAWRYDPVPDALWKSARGSGRTSSESMREKAHATVKKYFRFRRPILDRANEVNPLTDVPGATESTQTCLAVHIRTSDKVGKFRKFVTADKYLKYMEAFVEVGGDAIYVASDSSKALRFMEKSFPPAVTSKMRTQGIFVVRSPSKNVPTHILDDHHRVNSETLVDIVAMSKCQLMLYSYSTVPEAAIYLNPSLQRSSVNLEDPSRMTPEAFKQMTRSILPNPSKLASTGHLQLEGVSDASIGGSKPEQFIANATVIQGSVVRKCRSNAIVYLAQKRHSTYGRDSYSSLLRSLDLLHKNYLSIGNHLNNTDIFIFHTAEFNRSDLALIENQLGPSYRGVIRLIDLEGSPYWRLPKSMTNSDPTSWEVSHLFSIGYRHMMQFFAIKLWDFFASWNNETNCRYRYIFRLDEDSFIHSPIQYDIFDFMEHNRYVYGYRMCTYELPVAQRMWTQWWKQQRADEKPKRQLELNGCGFYNNFFVADLDFFRSPRVQAFLHFVAKKGHIYRWRLGDLVIHTMTVYGFAETEQVHRFLDFTYEHGTQNQTSGCLMWGGIQAGYNDLQYRATLDRYYKSLALDSRCILNMTILREADLSPSYSHHIPFSHQGRRLRLHTITAGRVELPNMGALSG